jgi:hypothetical protein
MKPAKGSQISIAGFSGIFGKGLTKQSAKFLLELFPQKGAL